MILLALLLLQAVSPTKSISTLTVDQGLSQNMVYSIAQDTLGFLWAGTKEGLNRYDGYEFKIYRNQNKPGSLRGNYVPLVYCGDDGVLWTATLPGGLHRYRYELDDFEYVADRNPDVRLFDDKLILNMHAVPGLGWWIQAGTAREIYFLTSDEISLHKVDLELEDARMAVSFFGLKDGRVLISTASGAMHYLKFDPSSSKIESEELLINDPLAQKEKIQLIQQGEHLYFVAQNQLWSYHLTQEKRTRLFTGFAGEASISSTKLLFYDEGALWLVHGAGLSKISKESAAPGLLQHYQLRSPITLFRDRSGIFWVGTSGFGLAKINDRASRFGYQPQGFQEVHFPELVQLISKELGKTFPGQKASYVATAIVNDLHDPEVLWIAFRNGGLVRWHRKKKEASIALSYSTALVNLDALIQDEQGVLWLASAYGVTSYHPKTKEAQFYDVYKDLVIKQPDIFLMLAEVSSALYKDSDGVIWLGNPAYGLMKYSLTNGERVFYAHDAQIQTSLSNNFILHINKDPLEPERYLWISTDGGGLNRFDKHTETFRRFTMEEGLPNNVIYTVIPGNDNQLWCSSNLGIFRIDPKTFSLSHFDINDGLQSNEFNRKEFVIFKNGELSMSGLYGTNLFNPLDIELNTVAPKVQLLGFTLFGKPVPIQAETHAVLKARLTHQHQLRIPWEYNVVGFEFAALEFTAPLKNNYRYRLLGFDEQWIEAGKSRVATYTNLNPGRYVFELEGSNNDGFWAKAQPITLEVTPPWWLTKGFLSLAFLVSVAALVGLVWWLSQRKHRKQLRELEFKHKLDQEKVRISRDMHDSLGARLTQIKMMSELNSANEVDLREISEVADEVIQQCSEMVWSLNPENDSINQMVEYMVQYSVNFCKSVGQKLRLHIEPEYPEYIIASETRHQLLMVLKEALNNAAKYAGSEVIDLHISIENKELKIQIQDHGRGFVEAALKRTGNGLKNMRARMQQLGGKMEIQSQADVGTIIQVRYPLP